MKTGAVLLLVSMVAAGLAGVAATREPDPVRPHDASRASQPSAPVAAAPSSTSSRAGETLSGEVREAFDVAQYTYLRLTTAGGEQVWAAVSKTPVSVGSKVSITEAARMTQFASATLKRTFDVIYFGQLARQADGGSPGALPPGHPHIDGHGAALSGHDSAHAVMAAPAPSAHVTVRPASGKNARTIAALFADSAALEGKLARVRGQIVKATPVQGVTYYRLRDGSSQAPATAELVVSSAAKAGVGEVATFEGPLRSNVDVGIGFKYPIMLQDAQLLSDP